MSFQELSISSNNLRSNYLLSKVDNIFSTDSKTFLKNVANDQTAPRYLSYDPVTLEVSYKDVVVPTAATYASMYNTGTFNIPQNTIVALQFNSTFYSNGISYDGASPSRIEFTKNGVYGITIQAQLEEAGGSSADVYGTLYLNGSAVANSSTVVQVQGNKAKEYEIDNKLFEITDHTTDYVEFKAWTASNGISANSYPSPTAGISAAPSVVANVIQII